MTSPDSPRPFTAADEQLIAAATVLLIRDREQAAGAGVEVLMLRRNSKIAFGGMWVFPGGRVDEDELGEDELESARDAAVRETSEEAGLTLTRDALHSWSHWQPPSAKDMVNAKGPVRRFSTWFFVANAPEGEVAIDHGEIHEHVWLTPQEAMARHADGEIELVPPTWITLHQLATHQCAADAIAWAKVTDPERFWTRPLGSKPPTLIWEGDADYDGAASVGEPVGDVPASSARHRLIMHPDGWIYERS